MRPTAGRIQELVGAACRLALLAAAATAPWGVAGCESESSRSPGGAARVDAAWPRQRPEFEAIADRLHRSENEYLGYGLVEKWRRVLRRPGLSVERRVRGLAQLAKLELQAGEVEAAVEHVESADTLAQEAGLSAEIQTRVLRILGLAYLRQAEVQNCIVRHNRECCIFPLQGGGVHAVPEPAARARDSYERYLKLNPNDLRAAWLLNIISMALGDYPEAVPPRHRIPPSVFVPEHSIARFVDVAPQLGLDTLNLCGGVIAEDFDGDGLIDIVTSTFDPRGPLTYYRNLGPEGWEDRSTASRLDDQLGGLNCIGADYDNDGDIDILVLRGAWLKDDGQIRNSLLRNNGDGTFTDVTRAAGLADPARPTQAAVWGDFDNDGDLDLYIVNESRVEFDGVSYPAQLFENRGGGLFIDVTSAAGVSNDRYGKGVTAGDYDNDGDLDIYVSNFGRNRLYRNDGRLKFTDVAPQLGVTAPDRRSFAAWFFDYDNDGWMDLFVTAYEALIADIAADIVGAPHNAGLPRLYRNNGPGRSGFTEVTESAGLAHAYLPMGANFGDADNDGWLDIYLTTGEPNYEALMPNIMLRNDAGRRFWNVTQSAGLGHLQKGHGVAFADFDNDGDQDIYHQLGGFFPGDKFQNVLFANPGHGHHFITIKLEGTKSNRQAIGARIKLVLDTPSGAREIHRAVGSVSSFGGSPLRQEIGLGDATRIRRLEIDWPTSGAKQSFNDVPVDSMIRVIEGESGYRPLVAPAFDLGRVEAGLR